MPAALVRALLGDHPTLLAALLHVRAGVLAKVVTLASRAVVRLLPAAGAPDRDPVHREPTANVGRVAEGTLFLDDEVRVGLQLGDVAADLRGDEPHLLVVGEGHGGFALRCCQTRHLNLLSLTLYTQYNKYDRGCQAKFASSTFPLGS